MHEDNFFFLVMHVVCESFETLINCVGNSHSFPFLSLQLCAPDSALFIPGLANEPTAFCITYTCTFTAFNYIILYTEIKIHLS